MILINKLIAKSVMVVAALLLACIGVSALVNITFGIDSAALVVAFDIDENLIMRILDYNVRSNVVSCGDIYEHGITYQAVAFSLVKFLSSHDYLVSERLLIVVLRIISFAAYLLLLVVAYLLMRRLDNDAITSLLATTFVASIPELVNLAQTAHPDTLQLLLIFTSLGIAISWHTVGAACIAAAVCGVAMATKMGSFTFLPGLILPALLAYVGDAKGQVTGTQIVRRAALLSGAAILSFCATFVAVFPQVRSSDYLSRMKLLTSMAHSGVSTSWLAKLNDLSLWLRIFAEQYLTAGGVIIAIGIAVIFWLLARVVRQAQTARQAVIDVVSSPLHRALVTIIAIMLVNCVAMIFIGWRAPRHIIAMLVIVALGGFTGIGLLVGRCTREWQKTIISVLLVLMVGNNVFMAVRTWSYKSKKYQTPVVQAAEWVVGTYGTAVPILGDVYTYLPPELSECTREGNFVAARLTRSLTSESRLIMLSRAGSGRFAWMKKNTRLREGKIESHPEVDPEVAAKFDSFLQFVASGQSIWKLVYENDEILVLEKKN